MNIHRHFYALLLLGGLLSLLSGFMQPVSAAGTNVACSTGSTACTLVSAVSKHTVSVYQIFASVSTADTLTFKCGSTTKLGPVYLGATAGFVHSFRQPDRLPVMRCAAGEAFTVDKGVAATPLTVWLEYEQ
ncbi:MAG: hypothetical protein AB7P76_05205 [Candidatus Melainabacteria bacterium]